VTTRSPGESVAFVTETLRGRLIDLDGQVFHFETDRGERIVFTLHEASGIQPHHLEGIVRSPVRIEVTIEGAHDHATATRVDPCEQYHPAHPLPWGYGMTLGLKSVDGNGSLDKSRLL
jgi:hypothetical protein